MAKKTRAFVRGFAQGFVPWGFVVVPVQPNRTPKVKMGTAWIQAGQSLRTAMDDYGRIAAGRNEETQIKESA